MTLLLRYLPHLLALGLAFAAGAWVGYAPGAAKAAKAELALAEYGTASAEALAKLQEEARQQEHRHAADMARISREHQEALKDAQASSDRLVADLRAGSVRLQERWRGCAARLPGVGASSGGADEEAGIQAESLGRIDRAVAECEAQILGLQGVTQSDRKKAGD